jgi:hypothetical protein
MEAPAPVRPIDSLSLPAAGLLALALLVGLGLARRNLKLGRADVNGAARLVGVYLAVLFGGALLAGYWTSSGITNVRWVLGLWLGVGAFWSLTLLVIHLALEPYLRRYWPERLSAWARLVAGHWYNPLVGRDVLVGLLVGVALSLLRKLQALADHLRGVPAFHLESPVSFPVPTPDAPVGWILLLLSSAIVLAFVSAMLLMLLAQLLRREWLAVLVLAAAGLWPVGSGYLGSSVASPIVWGGAFLILVVGYSVLLRFGLLAFLVAVHAGTVVSIMPVTLAPQPWYATTTWLTIGFLAVLAVYGARVALGRPLLPDDLALGR